MTTNDATLAHRKADRVEKREGGYHKVRITCACGRVGGKGYSKDPETARRQAATTFDEHLRRSALTSAARSAENRSTAGCLGIVGVVVLAVVLLVGFAVAHALGGSDDPDPDRSPSRWSGGGSGGGIDCEKAVSAQMEQMYGSWGSGSWPDGEYNERLRVCRGR